MEVKQNYLIVDGIISEKIYLQVMKFYNEKH